MKNRSFLFLTWHLVILSLPPQQCVPILLKDTFLLNSRSRSTEQTKLNVLLDRTARKIMNRSTRRAAEL